MVSSYAERAAATTDPLTAVAGLLAYLDAAAVVENGLAPAQSVVAQNRVQVLTVHAAKGLEWQVVAVPHLSGGLFPSTATARSWLTDAADLPAAAARRPLHSGSCTACRCSTRRT